MPENRFDQIGMRVKRVLWHVFGQRRLLNQKYSGVLHIFIFWGFCVFIVMNANFLLSALCMGVQVSLVHHPFYLFLADTFSILVLLGVGMASYRRLVIRPPYLEKSSEALIILALIAVLMITHLILEGIATIQSSQEEIEGMYVGNMVGLLFLETSPIKLLL